LDSSALLSSAAVAAVVSGGFLFLGTWVNGRAQRRHDERLRVLQFVHERTLALDADRRALRDRKLEQLQEAARVLLEATMGLGGTPPGPW
jgi:hypothetical protein